MENFASGLDTRPAGDGCAAGQKHRVGGYADSRIDACMPTAAASQETTRLTIKLSKQADLALRSYLGAHGMKKGDISKFIEDAVRWRIFNRTVQETHAAFADVAPGELQKMIDEAVEDVRAKRYRQRAK
ncbi:MAG: ribbon-helix-helix domain-containing protein [Bryobacteraceae bacterium]